jgi:hypothetical protein
VTEPAADLAPRRRPRWALAVVTGFAVFELGAGAVLVTTHGGPPPTTPHAATTARPAPSRPRGDAARAARRAEDVKDLLTRRAAAIRQHDRAAFVATLDASRPVFVRRQLAMFDALKDVPLSSWTYDVSPDGDVPPESPYLEAYDVEAWSPTVTLKYQLAGFDEAPTAAEQFFTFVRRGERWLTASDDDFPDVPDRQTARDVWDFGPVRVVRGLRSLVLGHPGHSSLLRDVAALADGAVPRVTGVWGTRWAQRAVIVVPETQRELGAILGDGTDLSRIAAVAVAQLPADAGSHPVGNRVIVNPPNFRRLGTHGRRVVITHEITHVATRDSSGNGVPTWLVEGFADYVGYLDTGLSARAICQELAADVGAGRRPTKLPEDADFDGGNKRLAQAYESSWLAVRLVVERVGVKGLVAFYRTAGSSTDPDPVRAAMRTALRTTPERFTAAWRTYVSQQLG